jgi:hypothetical protein
MNGAKGHLRNVIGLTSAVGYKSKEGKQAIPKLCCGLLCEGGKEDFFRLNPMIDKKVHGTPKEDTGFPRTRAGGKKEGAFYVAYGGFLLRIGCKAYLSPKILNWGCIHQKVSL